jgi:hypothetical protein
MTNRTIKRIAFLTNRNSLGITLETAILFPMRAIRPFRQPPKFLQILGRLQRPLKDTFLATIILRTAGKVAARAAKEGFAHARSRHAMLASQTVAQFLGRFHDTKHHHVVFFVPC